MMLVLVGCQDVTLRLPGRCSAVTRLFWDYKSLVPTHDLWFYIRQLKINQIEFDSTDTSPQQAALFQVSCVYIAPVEYGELEYGEFNLFQG